MLNRYVLALLIAVPVLAQAQENPGGLHPLFETYQGGSKESEDAMIRSLASKFTLLESLVGAAVGRNLRGTHAKGFCFDGRLEIYDQSPDNAWLKIGPFKKPMKGDARPVVRVRFADASGTPRPNTVQDVRSISISFEVEGQIQEFSMNNDPVFTFGNLTDFNNFLNVSMLAGQIPDSPSKKEMVGKLVGNVSAAYPDVAQSFVKSVQLGTTQQHKNVYAYHTENYGTGTAYSFGDGRAAKFKLVRPGGMPPVRDRTMPADAKATVLVDRTTSAINQPDENDPDRFCLELEVQILDVANMKVPTGWKKPQPPTAIDWVEDATLNWDEAGARSFKLGKLTPVPNSVKPPEQCEDSPGYNVAQNHWPELKPLGNINRARALAERKSREGRSLAVPAPSSEPAKFSRTKAINQGWNAEDRDLFWYLPQGSYVIPYDWFLVLMNPETKKPLRSELAQFGFLEDDSADGASTRNPDHLPIGMTRESPPADAFKSLQGKGDWLGITCAACHVGAITVNDTRYIVDGGPAWIDLEKFSLAIEKSLSALKSDPTEFQQFLNRLPNARSKVTLDDLSSVLDRLYDRNSRSFFHTERKDGKTVRMGTQTVNPGPGRTDAFGVILNEVASRSLGSPSNEKMASAPVSFPHLWGAPLEDWVQYSGLSNNPMTRNLGQVMGVFGDVILDPKSDDFLATTARIENLNRLEDKLRSLTAPKWEQVFGPFSDEEYVQIRRGSVIFAEHCMRCHSHDPKIIQMVPFTEYALNPANLEVARYQPYAGTDPLYFANLIKNWSAADTGLLKGTSVLSVLKLNEPRLDALARFPNPNPTFDLTQRLTAQYKDQEHGVEILSDVTMAIFMKYLLQKGIQFDPKDPRYQALTGGALPAKQTVIGFRSRSLDGIAFTGPYFHNGSVRTLREVLYPEDRATEFYIGSTGYDQKNGGFENAGSYLFRASKLGNLNIGHDFGAELSNSQKDDLLVYLKSL